MKTRNTILAIVTVAALLQATTNIGMASVMTAQATNPPYLREMPSVERVKSEIKGADALDTAARQMGAFWQLQEIIKTLSGLRWARNELTADERRLLGQYSTGYHAAGQPYAAYPDRPKWFNAHSFYEVDEGFRDELFKLFLSPALREQFFRVKGETKAVVQQRKDVRAQALKEEQEEQARAKKEFERQFQTPEWKRKLSRCLASGRSESQCFTDQLGEDIMDSRPAGLTMSGVYSGQGGFSVTFAPDGAAVACKGVSGIAKYTIQRDGNQLVIRLLQPSPADVLGYGSELMEKLVPKTSYANPDEWQGQRVAFPVRADGKLAASGTIRVTGPVPVGTKQVWSVMEQVYKTVTVYEQKTEQCPLSTLTATAKASPLVGGSVMGTFTSALGMVFDNGDPGSSAKVPEPGLRMNGRYAGPTGFEVEFHPESAVIGCRQATVARDYSVTASGGRVLVNIQNGGTPLALELRPDGALAGAGQVQVNGRILVGTNRRVENTLVTHDPVFQPVTDTCTLGVLTSAQSESAGAGAPAGAGGAPAAARQPDPTTPAMPNNAPAPAAAAANAFLTVTDAFAVPPGTPSPFAGRGITLWKESWENIIRKAGVRPPPGTSAIKVWLNACAGGQPLCQQVAASAEPYAVANARFGAGRQAQLQAVPPGIYYVFAVSRYNNQLFLWDLKVELKPGPNAVTLNQRNSTPVN